MSVSSALRAWLADLHRCEPALAAALTRGQSVVVGLSGGADSLALTWAAVRQGWSVHAVVVDHQLQAGSAAVAARAAQQARDMGATAEVVAVQVSGHDEAAARHARYVALGAAAHGRGVLIAHTATDEAEGFLLGLARGSGTDSLAGMRPFSRRHPVVTAGASWIARPLLLASREDTEATCLQADLEFWRDPHNASSAFLRSRVRHELLPQMQRVLGAGIERNLARSARLLRDDADALDALAREVLAAVLVPEEENERTIAPALSCATLALQPPAIRRRVYRLWLTSETGPLTGAHIDAIDRLVTRWRGQGPVAVPWSGDSPTMNEYQRATHRLVVGRVDAQLHLDVSPR